MKKGFTLMELLVSLIILSISLVFISAFVLNLRNTKSNIVLDIPLMVNRTSITRRLNEDAQRYKLSSVTISNDGRTATLGYKHTTNSRTLEISTDGKTLTYKNNNSVLFANTLSNGNEFVSIEKDKNSESFDDGKSLIGYNILLSNGEKIDVYYYTKSDRRAKFIEGEEFNKIIKKLVKSKSGSNNVIEKLEFLTGSNISTVSYSFGNNVVVSEVYSVSTLDSYYLISMQAFTSNNKVRIYIWSEDPHPLLNENSSHLFDNTDMWNYVEGTCPDSNCGVANAQIDLSFLDTSLVKDMSYMFRKQHLNVKGLETWDVGNVENMSHMFENCWIGNHSFLSEWDVSSVKDMSYMFSQATYFSETITTNDNNTTTVYKIDKDSNIFAEWEVSNVEDMSYMFNGAKGKNYSFEGFRDWNVSNVKNMSNMFSGVGTSGEKNEFTSLEGLEGWSKKLSKVEDMSYMFNNSAKLQDLSALSEWNVSSVKNMSNMFFQSISLTNLSGLGKWNVSNVTNFKQFMANTTSLKDASAINDWDLNPNADCTNMFSLVHPTFKKYPNGTWNGGTFIIK